ncbi:hypothetical protein L1987_51049 [Smallanthus sonchifolius]|uniref:Uncharacterized protein n=1 Tax=Smallanthus sonchifolius TaxID=185202 RepID=A0ACB9EPJ7_9ASTR|nr:hypothetical protein L1987_51049 [Smallanthus sonchifolius]
MSHDMPMPNDTMNHDMSMMHMTFFWGKDVVMLFNDWPNGKLGMYILALALVFVVAVAIKFLTDCPAINTRFVSVNLLQNIMINDTPMPMPMANNTMDGMTMHMTFFWGKDVVMLFNDWPNGKLGMYILALAFVFVVAVAIEVLSDFHAIKKRASPLVSALAQALVYGVRMALAYLVMLSVMSYNIGVFISVVVGHAFGCFLVKYRAALKGN